MPSMVLNMGVRQESDAKPPFSNISKAKACKLTKTQASYASSKAKVQACGSKAKLQTSGSKTFRVKIPPTMVCGEQKKEKRKISRGKIIMLSSDNSYDRKGPSKASVPKFEEPSVQGLLDWYGYNTIKEYLSWSYFSSTDKDITDKDCIHESNYAMSKGCVPGIANVTTWDENLKFVQTRQRITERCHMEADHVLVIDQICDVFLVCLVSVLIETCLHSHHAFASIRNQAFAACIFKQAFAGCISYICRLHYKLAFAACICRLLTLQQALAASKLTHLLAIATTNVLSVWLHLQQEFAFSFAAFTLLCNKNLLCCKLLQQLFATSICFAASYYNKHWQQAFATSICFAASYFNKHLLQVFTLMQATATSICSKHLLQVFALLQAFATSIFILHLLCNLPFQQVSNHLCTKIIH
ncbi:hypothetical protein Tco_0121345 [Tanacetum coccineum]